MNLKYYLRGLGIGVIVTALLMGFALQGTKEKLTDEEIMQRAEQLGMVQSGVLSDDLQNQDETVSGDHAESVPVKISESTESEKAAEVEKTEDLSNPADTDQKAETAENPKDTNQETETVEKPKDTDQKTETAEKPKDTDQKTETTADKKDKVYTITVYSGDDSLNVANRLEKMGIIKNAAAFDEYLCKNGYDKHLATGNHTVKAGMSDKDLAQALMRSAD